MVDNIRGKDYYEYCCMLRMAYLCGGKNFFKYKHFLLKKV
jgi:hypothetical protein